MKSQSGIADTVRRHHDRAFKARLVEECLQPGASVAAIAMDNGINANLLFKWRRDHRRAATGADATQSVLLPVRLTQSEEASPSAAVPSSLPSVAPGSARTARAGVIELEIAGAQLRLRGAVDEASLCSVLRALRHSA